MLKPPFGRFAARFSVFQAASFYMMSLRFLPEDECDVIEPPTVFYKSLRWLRDRGAVDSFATLLIFIEEMISADVNPQKSQTSIKKPSRSLGSRVCVLKLYFSFVFVFIRGELKCCNTPPPTAGRPIPHEAVVHHFGSGSSAPRQRWDPSW